MKRTRPTLLPLNKSIMINNIGWKINFWILVHFTTPNCSVNWQISYSQQDEKFYLQCCGTSVVTNLDRLLQSYWNTMTNSSEAKIEDINGYTKEHKLKILILLNFLFPQEIQKKNQFWRRYALLLRAMLNNILIWLCTN